jgi:SNF2 family DNA or RNA helicase
MLTIEKDNIYFTATEQTARKLDAVWVKSKNAYKVPNTLGALRELHKAGYDVAEYGKKKAETREKLLWIKNHEDVVLKNLGGFEKLRPYQRTDIQFMINLPHAAVFNEQRTGKTPTTLKLLEAERHEKIIIICPASLVLNWKKEVETWTSLKAFAVNGTKTKRTNTYGAWTLRKGCLILSKDTAKADVDLLSKFSNYALVVDEAHFLRNYKSQQSKAVFQLGKNASKRLALTGTPAVNKGDDLYGILHFLYPSRFSSYWAFVERYFKVWDSPWGVKEVSGYKRKEELQEILDLISVQRKRSEVMQWVPPKQYQTIPLKMDSKQRKAYDEMLHMFTVEEADLDAPSVLAQLTRLRQICLAPELLNIAAPSAKEQFILEWLENNPNEQVIIFSNFSSYLKKLALKIAKQKGTISEIGVIIGETPKQQRQSVVDNFQSGKYKVILANIQAAGVGLTLDKASTVIFLDRAYTPSENAQAEDRIVPTTENSNQDCMIIDVVCENSIDEHINDILSKKKSVIEVVNNYKSIGELMK